MNRVGKIGLNVGLLLLAIFALMSLGGLAHAQLPVDHYKCYLIEPPSQVPGPLLLSDQFHPEEVAEFLISRLLCAPVSKQGSEVLNPDIHLKAYEIFPAPPLDPPALVNLFPLNEHLPFELDVRVIRPLFLLVPTLKERLQ